MLTQFRQGSFSQLVTDAEMCRRKVFGFVEIPVPGQAKAAVTALNEKELYGRKISLKEAVEKQHERRGDFQRPRREYRSASAGSDQEVDGNRR